MSGPRLRALVLEDEWATRNYLVELIEGSGLATVVAAVADTEQAWAAVESGPRGLLVDVAFVDIHLAGEQAPDAGLGWLRAAAATTSGRLRFVLTTASRHHALEAFELGVRDYLVKPFTEERVAQCLRRLVESTPPAPAGVAVPGRVAARAGRQFVLLPVDEVWAFEAAERLSRVHTRSGVFDVDLSLTALGTSLGEGFLRVHRNWLVRLEAVRGFEREPSEMQLTVGGGSLHVPVARDRASQVRDALLASAVGLRR